MLEKELTDAHKTIWHLLFNAAEAKNRNQGQLLENNQLDLRKPVPITANLNTIKFVLSGAERRKRKVGVLCSLATTHVSKYKKRGTVSPGNGGGSPFCLRGLRRQNDESQNVMLTVWNSTTVLYKESEKANTRVRRGD